MSEAKRSRCVDGREPALSPPRERVDSVCLDPTLHFVALKSNQVTDLYIWDPTFRDDATHVANRDAELVGELLDTDQGGPAVAMHVLLQSLPRMSSLPCTRPAIGVLCDRSSRGRPR